MSKTDPDCASQRGKASLAHENEQARSEPLAAETETGAGGRFGLRTTSADEESCSGELQDGERRPGLSNAGTFSDSQIGVTGPSLSMAAPVHTLVPTNTNINTNTSTNFHAATHPEGYVAPSSYLRRYSKPVSMLVAMPETAVDRDQQRGLQSIRNFLKVRTSYDVLPLSFRLIILDTRLLVKKSLNILNQNGIVSAPLWDSDTSTFAGLLTTSDYINVIQYYWQHPEAMSRMDQFRLNSLRDIEKAIGVAPIETISIHPLRPLYEACTRMLETRARRMPIVDIDDDTRRAMVVSVITQYRILKFIAVNVTETQLLCKPLKQLKLGTYEKLETVRMETPVIEVIHQLVHGNISSVPILNSDGVVVNVFEAVDVITLIKGGAYDDLTLSVGEALQKRPSDFPGIYTCSLDDRLDTVFDTLRKSRVHRFVVIDEETRLKGLLSLSDILEYVLLEGSNGDHH